MQPLAIIAIATGVIMIAGVVTMLILTRRRGERRPASINRWHLHGTVPLAAAAMALGVVSRSGGQVAATRDVIAVVAAVLFLGAFGCALTGAIDATRGAARR